jgi:hypothetical protein
VTHPILGRVMLAFDGETMPPRIAARLAGLNVPSSFTDFDQGTLTAPGI